MTLKSHQNFFYKGHDENQGLMFRITPRLIGANLLIGMQMKEIKGTNNANIFLMTRVCPSQLSKKKSMA